MTRWMPSWRTICLFPEQVTAEVVEKPKTCCAGSVQPAQTPAEQPQNVIVLEQKPPAAAYTQSSPVEEICRQMTYEQAQNVIVDCGTCKAGRWHRWLTAALPACAGM